MDNRRAIFLMILAMAGFAIEDLFIKLLTRSIDVGQLIFMIGLVGAIVFALWTWVAGGRVLHRGFWHPAMILRNLFEAIGTVGYTTAIARADLSLATSILQAAPLLVTLGSAIFLGEEVGWRRWSAICVGFLGILIIIRPGLSDFDPAVLWAVIGVLGLAARDVATRRVPKDVPSTAIASYAYLSIVPIGAVMMLQTGDVVSFTQGNWLIFAVIMAIGVLAYLAVTIATRIGEASVSSPFRYARIVFALGLSVFFLGERPDVFTLLGVIIVVASGIFVFWREHMHARQAA